MIIFDRVTDQVGWKFLLACNFEIMEVFSTFKFMALLLCGGFLTNIVVMADLSIFQLPCAFWVRSNFFDFS